MRLRVRLSSYPTTTNHFFCLCACVFDWSISGDILEARIVHEQLIRLLEQGNPHLIGSNMSNLHEVLGVLAKAEHGIPLVHIHLHTTHIWYSH